MGGSSRVEPTQPPFSFDAYVSTRLRGPAHAPMRLPDSVGAVPVRFADLPTDADLTRNGRCNGEPVGERIIVTGHVRDGNGRPVAHAPVELWQANAAGRYVQKSDQHDAPLDPNFLGAGRCETGASGHYAFRTVRPGAYPWQNHPNAWRPSHIHLSLFGPTLGARLITQMYFPGDPLLGMDPILNSVPGPARRLLMAELDLEQTEPGIALAYRFDIVLGGPGTVPAGR